MSAPLLVAGLAGLGALALLRRGGGGRSSAQQADPPARGSWAVKHSGIKLTDGAAVWLTEIAEETGLDLVVTSGTRSTWEQAEAMAEDYAAGVDQFALYAQDDLLTEILLAAGDQHTPDVAAMAAEIEDQVARGRYVSSHLREDALDLRTRDLSADQVDELVAAVRASGARAVLEVDHLHVEDLPAGGLA